MITQEDIENAKDIEYLGPAYVASHRIVEAALEKLEPEAFKDIAKPFVDAVYEKIQNAVESSILFDAQYNISGQVKDAIDGAINALLSGEEWALRQYVTEERHNNMAPKMRETIARLLPDHIMAARVADLEKQVERLKSQLDFAQGRY